MNRFLRLTTVIAASALALIVSVHFAIAAPDAPGTTGSPIVIAATPGDSKDPAIAVSGSITHVVWTEVDWIMYSASSGLTWTVPISIATGDDPALTIGSGGIPQLAFTEFFSPSINVYTSRYTAGAWTAPLKVSSGLNNTSLPDIAAAPNGTLAIAWSEQQFGTPPRQQLMLAESTNGGATWPTVGPILNMAGSAPQIAYGSDNTLHMIWQDNTSAPYRIKHSQQAASTWSLPVRVSDNSASSFAPAVAMVLTQTHIVWQQLASIRYAYGANLTWSAPVTLSTSSASEPAIAAMTSGSLLAAWDAGTTIQSRQGGPTGWLANTLLVSNTNGVGHVALAPGANDRVNAAFTWGASGSRDIAYNWYSLIVMDKKVHLPLVLNNN
jgi:hypothetical protein